MTLTDLTDYVAAPPLKTKQFYFRQAYDDAIREMFANHQRQLARLLHAEGDAPLQVNDRRRNT